MSVPRGADVGLQWRELSWGCLRSCWWRPPGGVRSQQKKAKTPECSDSKGRKAPTNAEMHLPESSELQIRYFQCSMRDTISLKTPTPGEGWNLPLPCQSSQQFLVPTPGSRPPLGLCFMTIDPSLTRWS